MVSYGYLKKDDKPKMKLFSYRIPMHIEECQTSVRVRQCVNWKACGYLKEDDKPKMKLFSYRIPMHIEECQTSVRVRQCVNRKAIVAI